ncbi:SGNH/GDSL hydrolase family protein [Arachidicoccus sp.]|uniref:SGNH/GDSL hydrolase family protein n=1 Tax=Arachidicoccus sp. TaxID=1872624 RepID=UPI003D1F9DD1
MKSLSILFLAFLYSTVSLSQDVVIKNDNHKIRYSGRMEMKDSATIISWTGSSAQFNFRGKSVKALLGDEMGNNFFNLIVDGKVVKKIHLKKGKHEYRLCDSLKNGKHSIELFKITEAAFGKTSIYVFQLNHGAKLLSLSPESKRRMAFFGNSITCGYADEDLAGDNSAPEYENGYMSYAAITARKLHADFHCISKSGIGIVISWFPLVMPQMYDRLYFDNPDIKWDFARYSPQIVVVNLFQNDSWIVKMPENSEFKSVFGQKAPTAEFIINAYESFIKKLMVHYPNAKIICALGNMDASKADSPWIDYIKKAVAAINNSNLYTCIFPYKGTSGHPSEKEQLNMANQLTTFIDKNIKW